MKVIHMIFTTFRLSLVCSFLTSLVLLEVQVFLSLPTVSSLTQSWHVSHSSVLLLRKRPSSSLKVKLGNNGRGEIETSMEYFTNKSSSINSRSGAGSSRVPAFKSNFNNEQKCDETNNNKCENDGGDRIENSSTSKDYDIVKNTILLLSRDLWMLPLLSLLSGISPSVKIIGESHLSRLPDCPIAHDIDTLLLWPAVMGLGGDDGTSSTLPPTIFNVPSAAITDESMYGVDWSSVLITYASNVATSLLISFMLAFSLLLFIEEKENEQIGANQ